MNRSCYAVANGPASSTAPQSPPGTAAQGWRARQPALARLLLPSLPPALPAVSSDLGSEYAADWEPNQLGSANYGARRQQVRATVLVYQLVLEFVLKNSPTPWLTSVMRGSASHSLSEFRHRPETCLSCAFRSVFIYLRVVHSWRWRWSLSFGWFCVGACRRRRGSRLRRSINLHPDLHSGLRRSTPELDEHRGAPAPSFPFFLHHKPTPLRSMWVSTLCSEWQRLRQQYASA